MKLSQRLHVCESEDCISDCENCENKSCKNCVIECKDCEESSCTDCLEDCGGCGEKKACTKEDCSCYEGCHFCNLCRDDYLEECSGSCGTKGCTEHLAECEECNNKFCEAGECRVTCSGDGCETIYCTEHKGDHQCAVCEEAYCDDCRDDFVKCEGCKKEVCGNCQSDVGMITCDVCNEKLEVCDDCIDDDTNIRQTCSVCKKDVCRNCQNKHMEKHLSVMPQNVPGVKLEIGNRVSHPTISVPGRVIKISTKSESPKAIVEWDNEEAGMYQVSELKIISDKRRYYR